jgi:hypothetical protein
MWIGNPKWMPELDLVPSIVSNGSMLKLRTMSGTINIKVFCKDIPNHICYWLTRQFKRRWFLKHYPIRSFDDPCQPCLIVNWYQVPTLGRNLGRNISVKFGSIPLIHLENKIEKFYDPSNCNNFRAKTHALLCTSSRTWSIC